MTTRNRSGFSSLSRKLVGLVALAAATSGMSGLAAARGTERGSVATKGPAAKIVAVGPMTLHAYSGFAGGALYTAPAITRTDRDCQVPAAGAATVTAESITTFVVAEGQVACLATTTKGSFELLWHAVAQPAPAQQMLAKAKN